MYILNFVDHISPGIRCSWPKNHGFLRQCPWSRQGIRDRRTGRQVAGFRWNSPVMVMQNGDFMVTLWDLIVIYGILSEFYGILW